MIPEKDVHIWTDLITRAARFVASDFPNVDKEDLVQELWVYVLSNRRLDVTRRGVTSILIREGKRIAWSVRKEQLQQTSQYCYRNSDVRQILDTVFSFHDWERGFCPTDARDLDGRGSLDVRVDLVSALERISESYRAAIVSRYRDGLEPESGSASRRTLNRAIQRLTDSMNWYYPGHTGPGSRRVRTNASARAELEDRG